MWGHTRTHTTARLVCSVPACLFFWAVESGRVNLSTALPAESSLKLDSVTSVFCVAGFGVGRGGEGDLRECVRMFTGVRARGSSSLRA